MAKIECDLHGNYYEILKAIDDAVLAKSMSASCEDSSCFQIGDTVCNVKIYERYSYTGQNRVSLSVTLLGVGNEIRLSAVTSGGSQALIFKVNTFGEQAFLDTILETVNKYR
ncbi:MAG: hypothetical protein GX051_04425 [Clostridiales bacterium]|nr:hypothetical protein [Clostridiales bacterium]